jgi:rhodanese-related sulfurtransferase
MRNLIKRSAVVLTFVAANICASFVFAGPPSKPALPASKQTRSGLTMDATEASQWMNQWPKGTLFVDVRTQDEIAFVGAPSGVDAHVPYLQVAQPARWDSNKDRYVMEPNAQFAQAIQQQLAAKGLDKSSPILLICREGNRSARAADLLAAAGYTAVYSVTDGYEGDASQSGERRINGWRNAHLPWNLNTAQKIAY